MLFKSTVLRRDFFDLTTPISGCIVNIEKGTTDRRLTQYQLSRKPPNFSGSGRLFCVFYFSLRPMTYPRPNTPTHNAITAINPSTVNIALPSFHGFPDGFLCKRRVAVPPERVTTPTINGSTQNYYNRWSFI